MDKTRKIRIIAIASVVLMLAAGATVIATAKPNPLEKLDTYVATSMTADVLLADSDTEAPLTSHEHAADGSTAPLSFTFETPTILQSFSAVGLAMEPLHISTGGCSHNYGIQRDAGRPNEPCVYDQWHGTPCAFEYAGYTETSRQNNARCVAHRAVYGSIAPHPRPSNAPYFAPQVCIAELASSTSCRTRADCDPQTQSTFCQTSPTVRPPTVWAPTSNTPGPGTDPNAFDGCSSGRCNLVIGVSVAAEARNLRTPISVSLSVASESRHSTLAPLSRTVEIPMEGGSAERVEFTFRNVPVGELAGLAFVVGAYATAENLEGQTVDNEASETIRPVLPDGDIRISISPMSFAGTGYRDGNAVEWSLTKMPRAAAPPCINTGIERDASEVAVAATRCRVVSQ